MAVRWSEYDYNNFISKKGKKGKSKKKTKKSKYNNTKITRNGITFDSIKEYERWCELRLLERAGEIEHLERQVPFLLIDKQVDKLGNTERSVKYVADFMYIINGLMYVEDVKSDITKKDSTYILKRKLFKQNYPDYIFIENV